MTTVAYKDGVVAFDSRQTAGNTILDDDFDKRRARDGVSFFISGKTGDVPKLMDAWFGAKVEGPVDVTALVVEGGELWLCSWTDGDGLWKVRLPLDKPYSIGSGQDHAWTAMDLGCTAAQAVKMAMKRDVSTGGKVRTFKIKG